MIFALEGECMDTRQKCVPSVSEGRFNNRNHFIFVKKGAMRRMFMKDAFVFARGLEFLGCDAGDGKSV